MDININAQYEKLVESKEELEIFKSKDIDEIIHYSKSKGDDWELGDEFVAKYLSPDDNIEYLTNTGKDFSVHYENVLIDRLEYTLDRLNETLKGRIISPVIAKDLIESFKKSDVYEFVDEYWQYISKERRGEFYDRISQAFELLPDIKPLKDDFTA